MKWTIFYSWQSVLPNPTNRGFIQQAIEKAIEDLKDKLDTQLVPCLDRDTQNVPGTPDIASTIFEKIKDSQVFVCDVSIIQPSTFTGRRTPNPNVLLELGYAASCLGWERVICVYNLAFGEIGDLPFDLRTRRICTYRMNEGQAAKKEERNNLGGKLADAIRSIRAYEEQIRKLNGKAIQARIELVDSIRLPTLEIKQDQRRRREEKIKKLIGQTASEAERTEKELQLLVQGELQIGMPEKLFDEYRFRLGIHNTGEVTLQEVVTEITCRCSSDYWIGPESSNKYSQADGNVHKYRFPVHAEGSAILPDEHRMFPESTWTILVPEGRMLEEGNLILYWKLLLDNAPPCVGSMEIGRLIASK